MHHYGHDGLNQNSIHPTAVVSPLAQLGQGVSIGPWCVVDAHAQLEDGVILESRVRVYGHVFVGAKSRIYDGAVLGADPQDLKYNGEPTGLTLGSHCQIREYCTVHRGTGIQGMTRIGNHVLLMAYVHVAHDCIIQDHAVLANRVQLGGHVHIGQGCVLGGGVYVQQFMRIGDYSFVGGTQKVERHVPPFSRALGNPLCWAGINLHGLRRADLSIDRVQSLRQQIQHLYQEGRTLEHYLAVMGPDLDPCLQDFFVNWKGGLLPKAGLRED